MTSDRGSDSGSGPPEELLDLAAASEVLGVPPEQVQVMAEQGLLTPQGDSDAPSFYRAEVIAAREAGA